jgi:hypothetical protein
MVISQKVKDEGKLKKISLYIGFVTREKGRMCYFRPDNLCQYAGWETLRCFRQIVLTFQTKRPCVLGKTSLRFR